MLGKPNQNRRRLSWTNGVGPLHIASSNGQMQDEALIETLFRNLAQTGNLTAAGVTDYNTERPHSPIPLHALKGPRAERFLKLHQLA